MEKKGKQAENQATIDLDPGRENDLDGQNKMIGMNSLSPKSMRR